MIDQQKLVEALEGKEEDELMALARATFTGRLEPYPGESPEEWLITFYEAQERFDPDVRAAIMDGCEMGLDNLRLATEFPGDFFTEQQYQAGVRSAVNVIVATQPNHLMNYLETLYRCVKQHGNDGNVLAALERAMEAYPELTRVMTEKLCDMPHAEGASVEIATTTEPTKIESPVVISSADWEKCPRGPLAHGITAEEAAQQILCDLQHWATDIGLDPKGIEIWPEDQAQKMGHIYDMNPLYQIAWLSGPDRWAYVIGQRYRTFENDWFIDIADECVLNIERF